MKKQSGARWEIVVDGKPRSYDRDKRLAINGAEYLKAKNPNAEATVRDLEGLERPIIVR
jgi:hypothetical protein